MSDVNARIAALEAQLAELKAEVAAPAEPVSSRRGLIKKLAIGAVTAAGVGSVMNAQPAAAIGGSVLLGVDNPETAGTSITAAAPGGFANQIGFLSNDGSDGSVAVSSHKAALGGFSGANNGIYGYSQLASGVVTSGGIYGVEAAGFRAPLKLNTKGPLDRTVTHVAGEFLFDPDGTLWFCVGDGGGTNPPGLFVKLAGKATAGQLHLLPAPVRVYDSRPVADFPAGTGDGPVQSGAGAERAIDMTTGVVSGKAGKQPAAPLGASGALFTLTIITATGAGFAGAFASFQPWPGNSTINWTAPGQIIATTTVSALNGGHVTLHADGGGTTDFVIDVIGYYA